MLLRGNNNMQFNRTQISEVFDVNLSTIDKWRRSGCPSLEKGNNVLFKVRDVSDWLRNRDTESGGDLDLSQERAKLTKLQAEKAKLDLEQQRGNLLCAQVPNALCAYLSC